MRAWELYTTPSVCPGCATGCNIEVQHSRGQVYRLVPRVNPAVNKHWMCDEGRFTYKRMHDRAAGGAAVGRRARSTGTARSTTRARALRAALDGDAEPGRRRVQRAVDQRGSVRAGAAGVRSPARRQGVHGRPATRAGATTSCVSADKNPNTAGAMAIGAGRLRSLLDLANDLKAGAVTALLVRRHATACSAAERGRRRCRSTGCRRWSSIGTHRGRRGRRGARRAAARRRGPRSTARSPTAWAWSSACAPPSPPAGDALPGWEILSHLARKLGATMEFVEAKAVFAEAKQKLPFMKDADWGRPMLPVQLRFAELARLGTTCDGIRHRRVSTAVAALDQDPVHGAAAS